MPSVSPVQKRTMAALAHGWKPKNKELRKIPLSVAKEYNKADQQANRMRSKHVRAKK